MVVGTGSRPVADVLFAGEFARGLTYGGLDIGMNGLVHSPMTRKPACDLPAYGERGGDDRRAAALAMDALELVSDFRRSAAVGETVKR